MQAKGTRNTVIHAGEYKLSLQEKDNVFDKMIDVVNLSKEFDQKTIQILKKVLIFSEINGICVVLCMVYLLSLINIT